MTSGRPIQSDGILPDVVVPSLLPANYKPTREVDLDRHLLGANEKNGSGSKNQEAAEAEAGDGGESEEEAPVMPTKPVREMTLAERLEFDKQLNQALEMLKNGQIRSRFTGVLPAQPGKAIG